MAKDKKKKFLKQEAVDKKLKSDEKKEMKTRSEAEKREKLYGKDE